MRKYLLLTTLAAAGLIAAGIAVQAQPYGPGTMGNGHGNYRGDSRGYGMMGGAYGPDNMMGGSGYGPGMMDYGSAYGGDRHGRSYRGQRQCWNATDSDHGYYAPCNN